MIELHFRHFELLISVDYIFKVLELISRIVLIWPTLKKMREY